MSKDAVNYNLCKTNSFKKNHLLIFVKAPIPGKVKTRLGKDIGHVKSANLYKKIAQKIILKCMHPELYTTLVFFYPYNQRALISQWLNIEDEYLFPQICNNIGDNMFNAFKDSFEMGAKKSVLIGSDCIDINKAIITDAFNSLESCNIILGPSFDGGYYLIGLNKPDRCVFEDIKWGTDSVFNDTLKNVRTNKMKYKLLKKLDDIDTLEDLEKYDILNKSY